MRKVAWIAIFMAAAAGLAVAAPPPGIGNETENFTYDARGRLVRVEHSGSVNNNVVANYTYDKADNRTNLNVTGAP